MEEVFPEIGIPGSTHRQARHRDAMTDFAEPSTRLPSQPSPRHVSKFEFNLLRILRFLVGHFPSDQGLLLLRSAISAPECLSPNAIHLMKDTLAKAGILSLVRAGGWRNERFLRGGEPAGGRVWQRSPLDERALVFSRHVVSFLMWATAERLNETQSPWDVPEGESTPADELFFWMAFDAAGRIRS